jgi:C1A family cysteine protease
MNYDFFKETNCTPNIKDQEYCGSCWAFASTTALAYRYHKLGIDVDLSPQYLISCYLKDCSAGDYIINAQFALVTHGTVTEQCFPYSSGDGIIVDECPSECKNDEEFKILCKKCIFNSIRLL